MLKDDSFELYNLRIDVVGDPSMFACGHMVGPAFQVIGEDLVFGKEQSSFSMFSLSSLLPLLAVKQRHNDINDWIETDDLIACPDPKCGARFKIIRTDKKKFSHDEVTKVNKGKA